MTKQRASMCSATAIASTDVDEPERRPVRQQADRARRNRDAAWAVLRSLGAATGSVQALFTETLARLLASNRRYPRVMVDTAMTSTLDARTRCNHRHACDGRSSLTAATEHARSGVSNTVGIAVVFPGQGTQQPGMAAPWRDHPSWAIVEQRRSRARRAARPPRHRRARRGARPHPRSAARGAAHLARRVGRAATASPTTPSRSPATRSARSPR